MNLTHSEILDIIKVSRSNPAMDPEDIFMKIVENNNSELKYHTMIDGFSSLFIGESEEQRPSCKIILATCCGLHDIFPDIVKSKSKKGELVRVRQQYCLIAHLFRHFQRIIGREIYRGHVTALAARNKALYYYQAEAKFKEEVDIIISRFPLYNSTLMERLLNLIES